MTSDHVQTVKGTTRVAALPHSLASAVSFELEEIQHIFPPNQLAKFEGIGFSVSGNTLACTDIQADEVLLFRRKADGYFENVPYAKINGLGSGLRCPHDLSFTELDTEAGTMEMLAVAQRPGAINFYCRNNSAGAKYSTIPDFEICNAETKLSFTDGVAFVPGGNDFLAIVDYHLEAILFYRLISFLPVAYDITPVFELKHPQMVHPDGLAFSPCGTWLATANHGNHSVCIFQRNEASSDGKPAYGPEPVVFIESPQLVYPHSVIFTPQNAHLIVTNAGANYFCVYPRKLGVAGSEWSDTPMLVRPFVEEMVFNQVHSTNEMEGGPKGIAVHGDTVAACSPEVGIKLYRLRETRLIV